MARWTLGSAAVCLRILLILLAGTSTAAAQARFEAQSALSNRYVWRGITRTAKWSFQPQLAAGWTRWGIAFDGGVSGVLELGHGDFGERSEVGVGGGDLGEVNYWLGATVYDGPTAIQAGVIRYTYHGRASTGGIGSGSNTTELWASIDLRQEQFAPRLDAYLDVARVHGLYLNASAAVPVIAFPMPPYPMLYVEGDIGLNVGQEVHPGVPGSGYFDDTGVTHARAAFRLPVYQQHGATFALAYIAQLGFDRATRAGIAGDPGRGRLTHVFEVRLAYVGGRGS
jgi:hypothetical protein